MARKALVIGLGTTGTSVCDNLIERLEWETGHLRRVPWIKFLSIETAGVSGRPSFESGNTLHLPVENSEDLINVLDNPARWEAQIQPGTWTHPELRNSIRNIRGQGAGGIRQAGRLALLFPKNFSSVRGAIHDRLEALGRLGQAEAQLAYDGQEGDLVYPPRRRLPGEAAFTLDNHIDIYVVGSLCGGTASGTFIDLAYMIRQTINAYRGANMKLVGIFSGYPTNGQEPDYGANTFWALREYNHWATTGITFRARYEGRDIEDSGKPYDEFHAVAPETASTDSTRQLEAAVADYIYIRTFCPVADRVDAKRADFGNGYTTQAPNGAHQNFATFGISGIEYPARQLVQACQLTLSKAALTRWLAGSSSQPNEQQGIPAVAQQELRAMGLLGDRLLGRLLASPSGDRGVLERIQDHIQNRAINSGGDLAELDACDAEIEIALGGQPAGSEPAPSLPFGCVQQAVAANRDSLRAELRQAFAVKLRELFLQPERGITYCAEYVKAAGDFLSTELKRYLPDQQTGRTIAQVECDQSKERKDGLAWELEEVKRDGFMKALWAKNWAVPRLCEEWSEAAQDYYTLRVSVIQQSAVLEILNVIYEDVQRYRERLDPHAYTPRYMAKCLATIEESLREALSGANPTNYEVLVPVTRDNVAMEYQAAFTEPNEPTDAWKRKEQEAHAPVILALAHWAEAVFSTADTREEILRLLPRSSTFDESRLEMRAEDHRDLLERCRRHFDKIESVHILERLEQLGTNEAVRLTASMLSRCRPMLPLRRGDAPRFEDISGKRAGFIFFDGQRQIGPGRQPNREVQFFSQSLQAAAQGEQGAPAQQWDSNERYRVTAIREQTAFPLAVVDGFVDEGAYLHYCRQAANRITYASRFDILWYPVEEDTEAKQFVRWLLVLVAIGEIDTRQQQLLLRVPYQPGTVNFSRNLQEVRIQYSGDHPNKNVVRAGMQAAIVKFSQSHGSDGPGRLVVKIKEFIDHAQQFGLLEQEGMQLGSDAARDWLLPFLRQDQELWRTWIDVVGKPPMIPPALLLRHQGDPVINDPARPGAGPRAQAEGYYCDKCGFRFGHSEEDVRQARSCVSCQKVFVFD